MIMDHLDTSTLIQILISKKNNLSVEFINNAVPRIETKKLWHIYWRSLYTVNIIIRKELKKRKNE